MDFFLCLNKVYTTKADIDVSYYVLTGGQFDFFIVDGKNDRETSCDLHAMLLT